MTIGTVKFGFLFVKEIFLKRWQMMRSCGSKVVVFPISKRQKRSSSIFRPGISPVFNPTTRRKDDVPPLFHPEFGRFMLEATPGKPWGIGFKDLLDVERNMKLR